MFYFKYMTTSLIIHKLFTARVHNTQTDRQFINNVSDKTLTLFILDSSFKNDSRFVKTKYSSKYVHINRRRSTGAELKNYVNLCLFLSHCILTNCLNQLF